MALDTKRYKGRFRDGTYGESLRWMWLNLEGRTVVTSDANTSMVVCQMIELSKQGRYTQRQKRIGIESFGRDYALLQRTACQN